MGLECGNLHKPFVRVGDRVKGYLKNAMVAVTVLHF